MPSSTRLARCSEDVRTRLGTLSIMAKTSTPATLRLRLAAELLEEPGRTNKRRSNFSTILNQPVVAQMRGAVHTPHPSPLTMP
jgi:hypothetical protein